MSARQQRENHKRRKAKARADHQAKYGSWINRKKSGLAEIAHRLNPMAGPVLSLAALEALIARMERP